MISLDDPIFSKKELDIKKFVFVSEEEANKRYDDLELEGMELDFFWDFINHRIDNVIRIEVRKGSERMYFWGQGTSLFNIHFKSFICYFDFKSREIKLFEDE